MDTCMYVQCSKTNTYILNKTYKHSKHYIIQKINEWILTNSKKSKELLMN